MQDDLISRQSVLDIVDGYSVSQSNVEDVTQDIISDIIVLPSANPQDPITERIEYGTDGNAYRLTISNGKELMQEQSGDLIGRNAVLDAISRIGLCKCSTNEIEAVYECLRAVKALPPATAEPCEDTISRQAAIDAVKKNTFRLTFAEEQGCEGHIAWSAEAVYSDVIEGALLELPSVKPQEQNVEELQKRSYLEGFHEALKMINNETLRQAACARSESEAIK